MFEITLITVGKLKEKFYLSAAAEYEKRLKGYCQFKIIELTEVRLPENPSAAEIQAGLEKEADQIISKIPKGAWLCVMTPEGKLLSSEDLADRMLKVKNRGKSSGGNYFVDLGNYRNGGVCRFGCGGMEFPSVYSRKEPVIKMVRN